MGPGPEPPEIGWLEDGVPPVAPPDIPWLDDGVPPIVWPCPDGWREVTEGGVTTCDPYPPGGSLVCPQGEAHFPGEAACAPIGHSCDQGPFPTVADLDADAVIFVDASAAGGGDGSEEAPFVALAAGLDAARPGDTLALASGTYTVERGWPDGVSLRGLCALETRLRTSDDATLPAVLHVPEHGETIRIEDVTVGPAPVAGLLVQNPGEVVHVEGVRFREVTGDPRAALQVDAGASLSARTVTIQDTASAEGGMFGWGLDARGGAQLSLRRGVIERNREGGVLAFDEGTVALLEDLVVRDTLAQESQGLGGVALGVIRNARAHVRRAVFERNREAAVIVAGEATDASLEDLVVRDTLSQDAANEFGRGVSVEFGARVEIRRALFERNRDVCVLVDGEGTEAVLEDLVVRDTLAQENDGTSGWALGVQGDARVQLRRALLERSRSFGVLIRLGDSLTQLEDLVIRDTLSQEAERVLGQGLQVEGGARVELRRALVERNRSLGVFVRGDGTEAVLRDLVVRDTLAQERDGILGRGLGVQEGARVELTHGLFERNRDVALIAATDGTEAVMEDLAVRDTLPRESTGHAGRGLAVQFGAHASLRRGHFERNRDVGVSVAGARSRAALEDLLIRETLPQDSDGAWGFGLEVQGESQVELRRSLLERNRELGVSINSPGTLEADDLVIRDTMEAACRPECTGRVPGVNLGAYDGADVELNRFELAGAVVCGFQITGGSRFQVTDGLVRDHPIAVCLQDPGFPVETLRQNVVYVDNGVIVEATALPSPDLGEVVEPFDP
ncbi:MAG: hypothetical protein ACFCGT_03080 [Sandaracinaceae bacterium]